METIESQNESFTELETSTTPRIRIQVTSFRVLPRVHVVEMISANVMISNFFALILQLFHGYNLIVG
jgi:hypothetical protein